MNDGIVQRIAARLSLGLSVAFFALLAVLHVLEPEFNSGHLISEYQLGDYGFMMSLAFCLLGASALLVALSLGPCLHTRGGRIGWWGLLVIGAAFFISGIFPPVQTPVIGYLHGISALVVIGRLADCVHLHRQKPRPQRTAASVAQPAAMGDTSGLGWSGVVSCFSYCHQSHWPNEEAVGPVGEPRQQVFDRDLWHLVCGSCAEGHVEATVHHSKQFLKRSPPRIFEKGVAKRTA